MRNRLDLDEAYECQILKVDDLLRFLEQLVSSESVAQSETPNTPF